MKLPFGYFKHSEVTIWETSDELGGLYGCELCQAVQVHKRYRDPLWLYRQGSDFTEYTARGTGNVVEMRVELYFETNKENKI
jgi:hypothetical protein